MTIKKLNRIEERISKIKEELGKMGEMRPGTLSRPNTNSPPEQSRGLLAVELYPQNEEPHGICPASFRARDSATDCSL